MLPDGSLAGRVALVTGGGSGLGRAMALELGRLGAKVAVLGRRRHVLEETVAQLDEGVAVPADVREPNLVEEAFDIAEAELGPSGCGRPTRSVSASCAASRWAGSGRSRRSRRHAPTWSATTRRM